MTLAESLDLAELSSAMRRSETNHRVTLPANIVDVTVLLRVGSEPGPYEVQHLDGNLRTRSEATGRSDIENFVTTLRVRVHAGSARPD